MTEVTLSPAVVIGSGLVGASVAMALTRAGVEVHLEDKRRSHTSATRRTPSTDWAADVSWGVITQVRSSKRSARAVRGPALAEPARGCDPQ